MNLIVKCYRYNIVTTSCTTLGLESKETENKQTNMGNRRME